MYLNSHKYPFSLLICTLVFRLEKSAKVVLRLQIKRLCSYIDDYKPNTNAILFLCFRNWLLQYASLIKENTRNSNAEKMDSWYA